MIRHAVLSDVPRLVELGSKFFQEAAWSDIAEWDDNATATALSGLIENPECIMLVAGGEEIVGMISSLIFPLWFNPNILVAQEWFWYILPEMRGVGGIGVKLLLALEEEIQKRGVHISNFQSQESMPSLDSLYIRLGYRPAEKTFIKRI